MQKNSLCLYWQSLANTKIKVSILKLSEILSGIFFIILRLCDISRQQFIELVEETFLTFLCCV